MTAFDYVFLAVMGASLAVGAWRGLVSEVLALLAWGIAFVVARQTSALLVPMMAGFIQEPRAQQVLAFVAVFILCLIVLGLARLLLREVLRAVGLGFVDRSLGAVFGLLRGLFVALLVVLVGGMTDFPKRDWWSDATFAPPLETVVLAARPWLPEQIAKRIHFR